MATANLKLIRLTSSAFTGTSRNFKKGDVYFVKAASGNQGKIYVCNTDFTGVYSSANASKFEDYSVDTNTWRGIVNDLGSDSETDSLSAKQGKALKALIDEYKVNDAASDTKSYLLGHTAQGSTATATTKSTVYMESGTLAATAMKVGEGCTQQYDSTNKCLKFIFS